MSKETCTVIKRDTKETYEFASILKERKTFQSETYETPLATRLAQYGVATISLLLKITGLFCKRAL